MEPIIQLLSNNPKLLPISATILATTSLLSLQYDPIARRILSPQMIDRRRRLSNRERLYRLMKRTMMQDVDEILTEDEDMDGLIQRMINNDDDDDEAEFVILGIDLDQQDENVGWTGRDYYLFLLETKSSLKYQTPLFKFTSKLSSTFQNRMTSHTLCFIADASSGLGSHVLAETINGCDMGAVVLKEPCWMMDVALLDDLGLVKKERMQEVLYGLCRLDGWRVRHRVGESKTIVFTLPGQVSTPTLLPLLQKAFPDERHVFVYDGCASSVVRSLILQRKKHAEKLNDKTMFYSNNNSNMTSRCLSSSTPLFYATYESLPKELSIISSTHLSEGISNIVRAWMGSVDSFLKMKDDVRKNGYVPFVCRMGFLMGGTNVGKLGNGSEDMGEVALMNVLEFAMGLKSRGVRDEVREAAWSVLRNVRDEIRSVEEEGGGVLSEEERLMLEKCVFLHKGIFIGDKTLLDTVQPQKEWTLHAAKKLVACACCWPGEDEEEEDDEENGDVIVDKSGENGFIDMSTNFKPKSSFIDGKTGFAFDPTNFSK